MTADCNLSRKIQLRVSMYCNFYRNKKLFPNSVHQLGKVKLPNFFFFTLLHFLAHPKKVVIKFATYNECTSQYCFD